MEGEATKRSQLQVLWGTTYTMNPSAPWAEAVVVRDGRIVYVGLKEGSKEYLTTSGARFMDVGEGLILPGFQDAHVHPLSGMVIEQSCNLARCPDLPSALEQIKKYAQEHSEMEWIIGGGWNVSWFPDGRSLASVLDQVLPDRPALFRRSDGHAVWVNTAAMRASGVYDQHVPDPPQGLIERDPTTGRPVGSFLEAAGDLFIKHLPLLSHEARTTALELAMKRMASLGITAFQDALVRGSNTVAYKEAVRDPERFPLKSSLCFWWDYHGTKDGQDEATTWGEVEQQLEQMLATRDDFARIADESGNKRVRANAIKLMLDGVMETKTAYLHDSYCTCREAAGTEHWGIQNFPRPYLARVVSALDEAGFQIHCHAVGDQALTDVLDAFELAKQERVARGAWEDCDLRHQVAHLQLVQPSDIARFKALRVIANFQPLWSFKDHCMELAIQFLGERSAWQYPIRQVLDTDAHVCFGSDWFVSSMNPLDGIEVAITHLALGTPGDDATNSKALINPHQRISLEQALHAYTLGSAYAQFLEKETGSIEVGKAGDIIVLDKNLFKIPAHAIHTAKITHTFVDGVLVHAADSASGETRS